MLSQKIWFNSFRLVPLAVVTVLTACGPNAQQLKDQALKQQEAEAKKNMVLGPLDQLNRTILEVSSQDKSFKYGKCDQENAETRKKLITAVESQYGKVSESVSNHSPRKKDQEKRREAVPFAGGTLFKIDRDEGKQKGWYAFARGWKVLNDKFEQNNFASNWTKLLGEVRTLLDLDFNRLTHRWKSGKGKNYGISKDNIHAIEGLYQVLADCTKNESCYSPTWTAEQKTALETIPIYQNFTEKLSAASENEVKRAVIKNFTAMVSEDYEQYSFHLNPLVTLSEQDQKTIYHLPLDAHQFTDAERDFLKNSIEEIWTSEHAQLQIEWKLASENREVFEIAFHNEKGARANTTHGILKRVNLYNGTTNRALAHEIGHVLGFQEHYYEVWNVEHCAYETQFNNQDLMSNQVSGEVTQEEWDELKKRYTPEKPRIFVD